MAGHQAEEGTVMPVDRVKLSIFCPVPPRSSRPSDSTNYGSSISSSSVQMARYLDVSATTSVGKLKAKLEEVLEGGPLKSGQTLIWRGRRLKDDEIVGVFTKELEGVSFGRLNVL